MPAQPPLKNPRLTRVLIFAGWFSAIAVLSVWLHALHAIPLPATESAPLASSNSWRAIHAIGADCGCSSAVADALLARGPRSGWDEKILVVGSQAALARQLRAAGFTVEEHSIARFSAATGLPGAPWLAIHAPDGRTAYSGGYASSRPGLPASALLDAAIMDRVRRGETVAPYPAFGCATSAALRSSLDPLQLKYARQP
ncbi:hypothetical protein CMV30_12290 [Nibricoccus aquaticus]|uniref:Uncharacterized protein n=1 Tax=Nibricoccus aquaticus TaxID=2576891 RepID=A0A290QL54_9BACT|nr:hypothetical protein [Nibricoccus aquaticus]ATC64672.1 hypothetical protein CMV30_12290 [Nibricoccus aquaticus]